MDQNQVLVNENGQMKIQLKKNKRKLEEQQAILDDQESVIEVLKKELFYQKEEKEQINYEKRLEEVELD